MITGPVSWYWETKESERGRCREDAPDSFKSTAHPQGVCDARLRAAKLAGLVAAGLNLQINTDKETKKKLSRKSLDQRCCLLRLAIHDD